MRGQDVPFTPNLQKTEGTLRLKAPSGFNVCIAPAKRDIGELQPFQPCANLFVGEVFGLWYGNGGVA
jgi:hypothetical protein